MWEVMDVEMEGGVEEEGGCFTYVDWEEKEENEKGDVEDEERPRKDEDDKDEDEKDEDDKDEDDRGDNRLRW